MNFSQYYQNYLTLHQNKWNRRLHVIGQCCTISYVILVVYFEVWLLLVLSPVVVYPFAWSGHYFFEKNTPAAFSNPLWAKLCDWIMLKDILIGKIPA
ncbi:DUF962 domain-containing protein [Porticoccaceae bacterium]|nr:DUF962 domain-containing protein [Porticoccaceae bacterium]